MDKEKADKALAEIGKRIRQIRGMLNINQIKFAESIGIASCYLSEIEKGKENKRPSFTIFYSIAELYKVNLNFLFNGIGEMFIADHEDKPVNTIIIDERDTVSEIDSMEDLIWLMERSAVFKHNVLGLASRFFDDNESIIMRKLKNKKSMDSPEGISAEPKDY